MSSISRYARQIPTGGEYLTFNPLNPPSINLVFDFIPTDGNLTGNYPPGYAVPASQTGLLATLQAAFSGQLNKLIYRDAGKTIRTRFATTLNPTTYVGVSYFREYQVLLIDPITEPPGFLGGSTGSTFGVVGQATTSDGSPLVYATFYAPVPVGGAGGVLRLYNLAGGQM
jgi:hypothetical protein